MVWTRQLGQPCSQPSLPSFCRAAAQRAWGGVVGRRAWRSCCCWRRCIHPAHAPPRSLLVAGTVNIRGKLMTGVIKTTKMKNTVIIRKDYLHYIKKYNRFEKRHKNTPVHVSPAFRVKPGDEILAGQCRPISKTVRFNMLKVIRSFGGDKKGFAGM